MSRNKTGLTCFSEELRTLENKIGKQMPRNSFIQILLPWIISLSLLICKYVWHLYHRREQEKMPIITLSAIYSCNLAAHWSHEVESVKYISKYSGFMQSLIITAVSNYLFAFLRKTVTFWWSCVSFFSYLNLWWLKHIQLAEFAVKIIYQ